MPFYRSFYPTFDAANAAMVSGVAAINTRYLAAAAAALPTDANAIATGATTTNIKVLSVSAAANGMVKARVLSQAPDGRQGITQMQVAATDVPPLPRLSGFALVDTTLNGCPTVTMTARIAAKVQYQVYGSSTATITVPANTVLVDPFTGKTYQTSVAATGVYQTTVEAAVVEVDATQMGDVTNGSQLRFNVPLPGVAQTATVEQMVIPGGGNTATLLDPTTGATYNTHAFTMTAAVATAGSTSVTTTLLYVLSDNASALTVGKKLTVTSVSGGDTSKLSTIATVTALNRVTAPIGSLVTYTPAAITYNFATTEAMTTDDTGSSLVPFIATFDGTLPGFGATSDVLVTYGSLGPILGVVQSIAQSQAYPQPLAPELVGEGLTWAGFVQQEPNGNFSANIYSVPLGA